MKYYDVVLYATVREVVSVGARDPDEAAEVALQIVNAGHVACSTLDWEVDEVGTGDPLDLADEI